MIWLQRIMLSLFSGFLALILGMFLAATFWVPKASGLAGGAIVLGYGATFAVAAIVIGLIISFKLSRHALMWSFSASGIICVLLLIFFFIRHHQLNDIPIHEPLMDYSTQPVAPAADALSAGQ